MGPGLAVPVIELLRTQTRRVGGGLPSCTSLKGGKLDPGFFTEDDFEDDYYDPRDDDGEDYMDDVGPIHDEFEDTEEEPEDIEELVEREIDGLRAEEMGMAFAFADIMSGRDEEKRYDLNERTDEENWNEAIRLESLRSGNKDKKKKLRPFERMIDDILDGRRGLFD